MASNSLSPDTSNTLIFNKKKHSRYQPSTLQTRQCMNASNAALNELTGKQEVHLDFLSHCTDKELVELPREVTHLDARHIAQVVVDEVVAPDGHEEH